MELQEQEAEESTACVVKEDLKEDSSFLEYMSLLGSLLMPYPIENGEIGDRMLSLSNTKVVFGIIIAETQDSFMVVHPTILTSGKDGEIFGRLTTPSITSRIFKSAVISVSHPDDYHRYHFFKFLLSVVDQVPKLYTEERVEKIRELVSRVGNQMISSKQPKKKGSSTEGYPLVNVIPYESRAKH